MKRKKLEPPHDPMPNMTAMVDLVMCILIFFMLGSKFVQPETFLPSNMPVDLGFSNSRASDSLEVPLTLDLRPGGGVGVVVQLPEGNTNRVIVAPSEVPRTEEERVTMTNEYMDKVMRELKRRREQLAGKSRVIIKPAANLEYKHIAAVFGACQDAKFENICFAFSMGGGGAPRSIIGR